MVVTGRLTPDGVCQIRGLTVHFVRTRAIASRVKLHRQYYRFQEGFWEFKEVMTSLDSMMASTLL